ncbi:hypothetical protein GQ44DRAFT_728739 [Phaeosphaeriaceae sp. PMI808]|nr:hypothetical protein GQ44DRAFT_728739 [Phaeosphaeriaceae sp. PMI808]
MPAKPTVFTPIFVRETLNTKANPRKSSPLIEGPIITVPRSVGLNDIDLDVLYFFKSFLPMNVLMSDRVPVDLELLTMARTSSTLRDAMQAVAALHRKQQGHLIVAGTTRKCENYKALQAYDRSVRCMRDRIASNTFLADPSALWITFILGLFELMRDSSGTNWLSHFLHGTCTLLQLQNPESLACPGVHNQQRRAFFLTTRIFEIARSLIYTSPTFLNEPKWVTSITQLWENEGEGLWHPKEALFDILPLFSDLSIRVLEFCENAEHYSAGTQYDLSVSLANEGLILQNSLQRWWVETTEREALRNPERNTDTETLIGYLYYNAISIFLSGTFDYHEPWSSPGSPCAPILERNQINQHVFNILCISQELLVKGVSGVLLFFPLRVAGARANDICSRNTIITLFTTTKSRGFAVAEAFTVDLTDLWATKSILL